MIKVKFIVKGREVAPGNFGSALEGALFQSVAEKIQQRLQKIRCETHGQAPVVTVSGSGFKDLKFGVEGCCEELKAKVLQVLNKD